MKSISDFFAKIIAFFHKPAVEAAFSTVAQIVQIAQPIVQEIAALTPNRTVQEIATAYAQYGVPLAASISSDPTSAGNALLNLATQVVLKQLGGNSVAVNLVNTAVQIAVTALKAGA